MGGVRAVAGPPTGRLILLVVRSPAALGGILVVSAFGAGWQLVHPALPLGVLGGLVAGLVVWRLRWPASFEAHACGRGRSWWRGVLVYRRRWAAAMDTVGLTKERHGTDYVPLLLAVRSQPVDGQDHRADAARPAGAGLRRRGRPARPNLRRPRLPGPHLPEPAPGAAVAADPGPARRGGRAVRSRPTPG